MMEEEQQGSSVEICTKWMSPVLKMWLRRWCPVRQLSVRRVDAINPANDISNITSICQQQLPCLRVLARIYTTIWRPSRSP